LSWLRSPIALVPCMPAVPSARALSTGIFRAPGRSALEELVVYDDVVARYGDAPEPALREQVARALVNKGRQAPGAPGRSGESSSSTTKSSRATATRPSPRCAKPRRERSVRASSPLTAKADAAAAAAHLGATRGP
jgi:hypothetical protein